MIKMVNLPFSKSEFERRLNGVRDGLEKKNLDALICSIHWNVYYLTGLGVSPNHYKVVVIPREGELIGTIRELEVPGAKRTSVVDNWIPWPDSGDPTYMSHNPAKATADALKELNLQGKRIGIETGITRFFNHMNVKQYKLLKKEMPDTEFVDDENIVMGLRVIKSEEELACMRRAAVINERTILEAIDHIRPGVSQAEAFAAAAKRAWSHDECNDTSLHLQAGRAGALIHVSDLGNINVIRPGDMVFIEMGCTVKYYFNTRIRCVSVGEPSPKAKEIDQAILRGLNKAIEFIKPGVKSEDVDHVCRSEIAKAGYGDLLKHRLAYSVGLGWNEGEAMSLRQGDKAEVKAGMVFHMVPGIWSPELGFGISYSENVLVTEDGGECIDAGILERKMYVK